MSIPLIESGVAPASIETNFESVRTVLSGGVSLDNFNLLVLEGTTATASDSQKLFSHSMSPQPIGWFPLIGDVYVQEISTDKIDIRATKSEVNFKIAVIGGQPVSGGSVTSVGGPNYKTTSEEVADGGLTIEDIIDAKINIVPIVVETSVFEHAGDSGAPATAYVHVVNTATHFYVTQNGNVDELVRIDRSTGVSDTLTLGGAGIALSAMFLDGSSLWVSQAQDSGGTLNVYEVDLDTFTIASTAALTGTSSTRDVTDLYIDGTDIFLAARTTTINSRLVKGSTSGGVATLLTLATGNKRAKKMQDDGTYLWVTEWNTNESAANVYKVDKAGFTVSSTVVLGNERHRIWNSVLIGTDLWIPAAFDTSISTTSQDITYPTALLQLDIGTEAVTLHPIINASPFNAVSAGFVQNILTIDGFIYLYVSGEEGVKIVEFDTIDNTQRLGWFPFSSVASSTTFHLNDGMNIDAVSGNPIVFNTGTGVPRNFEYFEVDFSNISNDI